MTSTSPTQKNYKLAVDAMQLACEVLAADTFDEHRLVSPAERPRAPETSAPQQPLSVPHHRHEAHVDRRFELRDFGFDSMENLARCTCAYGRQLVNNNCSLQI